MTIARIEVSAFEVQLPENQSIEFDSTSLQKSAATNLELEAKLHKIGDVNVVARIDRSVQLSGTFNLKSSSNLPMEGSRTKSPDGTVASNVNYQSVGTTFVFERIFYSEERQEMLARFSLSSSSIRPSQISPSEGVFANIISNYNETAQIRLVAGVPEIGVMINHDDPSVPPRALVVRYVWTPVAVMEFVKE
ncbi:MAG: hypothetical protein IPK83_12050 [Planctomycetes bacterium]|nr:hypothetical protein [Planctomycetota bacterium]